MTATDIHQHLWPEPLLEGLRARSRPPYLRGWTLYTAGEAPYEIDPVDHDPTARIAADRAGGVRTTCLSISSPLGIEALRPPVAQPLLDAWHAGVGELPEHYLAWASVAADDPDLAGLRALLAQPRFCGLQLPATGLRTPLGWERARPLLEIAQQADKPVLVHPGPTAADSSGGAVPRWWAPVVGYTAQLQATWWAWHAWSARSGLPRLRVVFAAGAGLAPVQAERHLMRGGGRLPVDPRVFVDTSGTGTRALEAVVRALGIDALVYGSDAPYGEPLTALLGEAATRAVRETNPAAVLTADPTTRGDLPWQSAS